MEAIIAALDGLKQAETGQSLSKDRRGQAGSGMRGDKVRTYRQQDNIVTDHRTEKKVGFDKVMRGQFDLLV